MTAYGEIQEGLDTILQPIDIIDQPNAPLLKVGNAKIQAKDMTFSYGWEPVFAWLNFTIEPWQKVGIVWVSGAGKSTLVQLLLRQYDLQSGSIEIDNQNIAQVTQDSLRENIAMVPQDSVLFHRSLKDNIAYGKLDATDEEIITAAKKAQAHEFIEKIEEGYDTLVWERWVKLSGGQRQRIVIARAILKDAPILILDEATSALDSESEERIQEALTELMKWKTVIAIAHRLSTIKELDRILVFDEWKIIEDGHHDQLSTKEGWVYANLWKKQAGGFIQE